MVDRLAPKARPIPVSSSTRGPAVVNEAEESKAKVTEVRVSNSERKMFSDSLMMAQLTSGPRAVSEIPPGYETAFELSSFDYNTTYARIPNGVSPSKVTEFYVETTGPGGGCYGPFGLSEGLGSSSGGAC